MEAITKWSCSFFVALFFFHVISRVDLRVADLRRWFRALTFRVFRIQASQDRIHVWRCQGRGEVVKSADK